MTAYVETRDPEPKKIPGLDAGIAPWVEILRRYGVETYESCEGGEGHAFPEPTIRFGGKQQDGFHAFAIAHTFGLPVYAIRRFWTIQDGEPVGPEWEIVFRRKAGESAPFRPTLGEPAS